MLVKYLFTKIKSINKIMEDLYDCNGKLIQNMVIEIKVPNDESVAYLTHWKP